MRFGENNTRIRHLYLTPEIKTLIIILTFNKINVHILSHVIPSSSFISVLVSLPMITSTYLGCKPSVDLFLAIMYGSILVPAGISTFATILLLPVFIA